MIAYFETLFKFGDYDKVTLDFWYWSDTNYNAKTDDFVDHLAVMVSTGIGIGGAGFDKIWKQSTLRTWTHVVIDIPTSKVLVGFYFLRDIMIDGTSGYYPVLEGAYIDDIVLKGYRNPIPEHPIKITLTNTNDPAHNYGGNPITNGALPVNISFDGTLKRNASLMPGETIHFFVNATDLPKIMTLTTSVETLTYELNNTTAYEGETYAYTIHSTPI